LKTTKDYVIALTQKVEDFIVFYDKDKKEHSKEHSLMWKLIIGIPSSLVVILTLIKLFAGG